MDVDGGFFPNDRRWQEAQAESERDKEFRPGRNRWIFWAWWQLTEGSFSRIFWKVKKLLYIQVL